jgi:uncharacterized 2Fe-2S/4Fe-4S cluster protein (DUF4445 family)
MVERNYKVIFLPYDIEIQVKQGTSLLEAALVAGVHINASCGGTGVCGTCKVKIVLGSVDSDPSERINKSEYDQGIRLACRSRVVSDVVIEIPLGSRLDQAIQARENKRSAGVSALNWNYLPPVKKYFLELPPATLDDNASDLFRLKRGLKEKYQIEGLQIDLEVLRKFPQIMRDNGYKVTVTVLSNLDQGETFSR